MLLSRIIANGAILLGMLLTALGLASIGLSQWQALAASYHPEIELRSPPMDASQLESLVPQENEFAPELAAPPQEEIAVTEHGLQEAHSEAAGSAPVEAEEAEPGFQEMDVEAAGSAPVEAVEAEPGSQETDVEAAEPAPVVAEEAEPGPEAAGPQTEEVVPADGLAPTPTRVPEVPLLLVIPKIGLEAPVIPAETQWVIEGHREFQQWQAPDEFAAGWHDTSALLGEPGNTVLNGHNNIHGEVFVNLDQLQVGDQIWVYAESSRYLYEVTNTLLVRERYAEWDVRMENARWILPSVDERLTLVTCWPYESNTHRVIVVASPVHMEDLTLPEG